MPHSWTAGRRLHPIAWTVQCRAGPGAAAALPWRGPIGLTRFYLSRQVGGRHLHDSWPSGSKVQTAHVVLPATVGSRHQGPLALPARPFPREGPLGVGPWPASRAPVGALRLFLLSWQCDRPLREASLPATSRYGWRQHGGPTQERLP